MITTDLQRHTGQTVGRSYQGGRSLIRDDKHVTKGPGKRW